MTTTGVVGLGGVPPPSTTAAAAALPASLLMELVAIAFSLLPAIYAIAVHIFLAAFHERPTLFGAQWRRYWSPIILRLGYASFVVFIVVGYGLFDIGGCGIRWYLVSDGSDTTSCWGLPMLGRVVGQCTDINSTAGNNVCQEPTIGATQQLIIGILFVLLITAVSIKLLIQTRKIEVDGPIPPTRTVSQTTNNDAINNNSCDLGGKTIFITGAKLSNEHTIK